MQKNTKTKIQGKNNINKQYKKISTGNITQNNMNQKCIKCRGTPKKWISKIAKK